MANCLTCGTYTGPGDSGQCARCARQAFAAFEREHPVQAKIVAGVLISLSLLPLAIGIMHSGRTSEERRVEPLPPPPKPAAMRSRTRAPARLPVESPKTPAKNVQDMSVDELERWLNRGRASGPADRSAQIASIWRSLESCVQAGVPARGPCPEFDQRLQRWGLEAGPNGAHDLIEYAERHYPDEDERLRLLQWLDSHNDAQR